MIELKKSALFGKGRHRECYVHPSDSSKCIKIMTVVGHEEATRERDYYGLLARRGISWYGLSRYYGEIDTDRGVGQVFELIRDANGEISKTLEFYLQQPDCIDFSAGHLLTAMGTLRNYLLEQKVIPMNIHSKNIVYQRNNAAQGRLVLVDNIGHSDFVPLCDYVSYLARSKILRRWRRFERTLFEAPAIPLGYCEVVH